MLKRKLLPLDFRPMTAAEYRTALDALGLHVSHGDHVAETVPERLGPSAARFFHFAPRTSRNYAAGASPVPIALGAFIRLLVASGYIVNGAGDDD